MKNTIISFEGVDSVGKNTQSRLLLKWAGEFCTAMVQSFPDYDTATGRLVSNYLHGKYGNAKDVHPEMAAALYALDRARSKRDLENFLSGHRRLLILDRYVHSNVAFQATKIRSMASRLSFMHDMEELEFEAIGLPKPDITIFLKADPVVARELIEKRDGKAMDQHESNLEMLSQAYEMYEAISEVKGDWITIECIKDGQMRSIEDIHQEIVSIVSSKLLDSAD